MDKNTVRDAIYFIGQAIETNKQLLITLDQQAGDGDLGISMSDGFRGLNTHLVNNEEIDLGKLMMQLGIVFNEHAPSSLGTIISFGFMGMAKPLLGKLDATFSEFVEAAETGLLRIMAKAGSKPGEKTILDALVPAVEALKAHLENPDMAIRAAVAAAAAGSENTRSMKAVHGRAAYYGENSIGLLDGGAVVGKLIFDGILTMWNNRSQVIT